MIWENSGCEEGVLVQEGHYMHMNRERTRSFTHNSSDQYIDTSKERKTTVDFMTFSVNWKTELVFLQKILAMIVLTMCKVMIGYVSETLKLVTSNQMNSRVKLVCVWNVSFEGLKSNPVFKLFILIWSYGGLKMSDLGDEKSNEKFSITPIFDIFITAALCT